MQYDLSIIIPSRNEEFLVHTVEDLLKNKKAKTEILVGLDGWWPEPGLPDHRDVRVLYVPESIGQRALQNRLARMSGSKWVMKLDAHCMVDEGFDEKMLAVAEDDMTLVMLMRNLHVFDWVCDSCGMRTYQGPPIKECRNEECNISQGEGPIGETTPHHKEIVWQRKPSVRSSAYRFNKNLQFKYFPELRAKLPHSGLQETLSLQGSCFMCTREKYFDLPLCDESWGSWGQQGTEVAIKTWLSGGRVLCNLDTWYAHLFRTKDGFSWPYNAPGKSQGEARKISREIFLNDKWDKAIHPLSWLLEKFWFALKEVQDPEARWEESDLHNSEPSKGILYIADNELPLKIAGPVQHRIKRIAKSKNMELVSSTRKPTSKMGKNVVTREPRGILTMFKQMLKGLEAMSSDIVFFAEHDVLYPPEHFDFTPEDKNTIYFDHNWYKVHLVDGLVTHWDADQVSGMCAYRDQLIPYYKERIATYDKKTFDRKFEPYSGERSQSWWADVPHIDLRTGHNITYEKRSIDDFRNKAAAINFTTGTIESIPGWDQEEIRRVL